MHACMYVCVCICICICACTCTCICICICICMHVHSLTIQIARCFRYFCGSFLRRCSFLSFVDENTFMCRPGSRTVRTVHLHSTHFLHTDCAVRAHSPAACSSVCIPVQQQLIRMTPMTERKPKTNIMMLVLIKKMNPAIENPGVSLWLDGSECAWLEKE